MDHVKWLKHILFFLIKDLINYAVDTETALRKGKYHIYNTFIAVSRILFIFLDAVFFISSLVIFYSDVLFSLQD
jgi:hypothetical protein